MEVQVNGKGSKGKADFKMVRWGKRETQLSEKALKETEDVFYLEALFRPLFSSPPNIASLPWLFLFAPHFQPE